MNRREPVYDCDNRSKASVFLVCDAFYTHFSLSIVCESFPMENKKLC